MRGSVSEDAIKNDSGLICVCFQELSGFLQVSFKCGTQQQHLGRQSDSFGAWFRIGVFETLRDCLAGPHEELITTFNSSPVNLGSYVLLQEFCRSQDLSVLSKLGGSLSGLQF